MSRRTGLKVAAAVSGILILSAAAWLTMRPGADFGTYHQRQATADAGEELEPALSPDGGWLAYVARAPGDDRFALNVLTLEEDGAPRRLTPTSISARSPVWSPTGTIAFIAHGPEGCRVAVVDALSAERRTVASCLQPGGLAWLGKDRLIIADQPSAGQALRLSSLDLNTGLTTVLTRPPTGVLGDSSPVVADDARSVYFLRSTTIGVEEIHRLDLRSGKTRRIDGGRARVLGLAPGGRGALLVVSNRVSGTPALWRLASQGRWTLVANDVERSPTASRDGRRIAFARAEVRAPLWLTPFDGGEGRALTNATVADWSPVLSSDARRIAFLSSRSGTRELWAGPVGGPPRRLTRFEGPDIQDPAWSPDGRKVALAVPVNGNYDLRLVDVESGAVRVLTSGGGDERHPAFDPLGDGLYFSRRTGERYDLMRMTLSTGSVTVVHRDAIRALPSPDGRAVYFSQLFRAGLLRLTPADGRVVRVAPWPSAGDLRNWTVAGGAVWGLDRTRRGPPRLMRLPLDVGMMGPVASMPDVADQSGIAVIDGGVIYSRAIQSEADIILLRAGSGE